MPITCPITLQPIEDPVICPDGHTYERYALEEWVKAHGKSPLVPSLKVSMEQIITNYAVASLRYESDIKEEPYESIENKHIFSEPTIEKYTNENNRHFLRVVSQNNGKRIPRDVIILVDNSCSMSLESNIHCKNNNIENPHLSTWDITSHAVVTFLHSMSPEDRAGIVLFSDIIEIISPLKQMVGQVLVSTIDKLHSKVPNGTTNMYIGIKTALFMLKERTDKSRESSILLFTDGQPTIRPPLGEVFEMKQYLEEHNNEKVTLHTFGFGNSLMSQLLYDLAVLSGGSYNYIPDHTFVGTVFVNTIANLFSSYASNTRVICKNNTINIGSLQYGQNRWIEVESFDDIIIVFNQCNTEIVLKSDKYKFCQECPDIQDIISYILFLDTIRKCINLCNVSKGTWLCWASSSKNLCDS